MYRNGLNTFSSRPTVVVVLGATEAFADAADATAFASFSPFLSSFPLLPANNVRRCWYTKPPIACQSPPSPLATKQEQHRTIIREHPRLNESENGANGSAANQKSFQLWLGQKMK
jgi:hypothetical protein